MKRVKKAKTIITIVSSTLAQSAELASYGLAFDIIDIDSGFSINDKNTIPQTITTQNHPECFFSFFIVFLLLSAILIIV
jgi:hypothetical protein